MTDDERKRIEDEATWKANIESRVGNVEKGQGRIWYGFGAAALLVGTSIWDGLKQVLFK